MKIGIRWRPELSGIDASTRDEKGLRELFGEAETNRILAALAASNGAPVTLSVNGPDAGFLNLDLIDAEFRIIDEDSRATRRGSRVRS
jgi:hypothetical protein